MNEPDYSDTTLILPTLNEEENIGTILSHLMQYKGMKIMVVDDGSVDSTKQIIQDLATAHKNITFVDRSATSSKGIARSTLEGAKLANTKYILVMDADLQHPIEKIPDIVLALSNSDLSVCVRKEIRNWPLYRRLISFGAVLLSRISLSLRGRANCTEPTSGFFGFRKELLVKLNERLIVAEGRKFVFDALKQLDRGTRIAEISYTFIGRGAGSSKFKSRQIWLFLRSLAS